VAIVELYSGDISAIEQFMIYERAKIWTDRWQLLIYDNFSVQVEALMLAWVNCFRKSIGCMINNRRMLSVCGGRRRSGHRIPAAHT
jgi:hypothetical protein